MSDSAKITEQVIKEADRSEAKAELYDEELKKIAGGSGAAESVHSNNFNSQNDSVEIDQKALLASIASLQ